MLIELSGSVVWSNYVRLVGGDVAWAALVPQDVPVYAPHIPWRSDELSRVLAVLEQVSAKHARTANRLT